MAFFLAALNRSFSAASSSVLFSVFLAIGLGVGCCFRGFGSEFSTDRGVLGSVFRGSDAVFLAGVGTGVGAGVADVGVGLGLGEKSQPRNPRLLGVASGAGETVSTGVLDGSGFDAVGSF